MNTNKKLYYLNISDGINPWFDVWADKKECPEDEDFDEWIYESYDRNRDKTDGLLFALTKESVEELIIDLQKLLKE